MDELPRVLWAIRTISRIASRKNPFSMAFGAEVMSPVKVGLPALRCLQFNEISNNDLRKGELDFLDEMKNES